MKLGPGIAHVLGDLVLGRPSSYLEEGPGVREF